MPPVQCPYVEEESTSPPAAPSRMPPSVIAVAAVLLLALLLLLIERSWRREVARILANTGRRMSARQAPKFRLFGYVFPIGIRRVRPSSRVAAPGANSAVTNVAVQLEAIPTAPPNNIAPPSALDDAVADNPRYAPSGEAARRTVGDGGVVDDDDRSSLSVRTRFVSRDRRRCIDALAFSLLRQSSSLSTRTSNLPALRPHAHPRHTLPRPSGLPGSNPGTPPPFSSTLFATSFLCRHLAWTL
ncbi:hypothetical protein BXZ70DRAFT_557627 [Cristinia sonorae]|uniref:Uncharacterized protein n=1 Tax=Cristinia sonorae TaxID=1940300 RepID=A0A8K0UHZ1_9AGAR|nr:hypothetical protein BXZ70DRAFT_557627 [Cristinia sonorae]